MYREGKSTHINTRSWKCWLENNKLGENKSQILLWIKEEVLYDLEEHEVPWLGACRESKQVFSPKGALKRDENVDVLPSNEGHLSSLNPLWIWTAQCLLLHEKKKKNQRWDEGNPAPTQISHKSLPLWVCIHTHGKHDSCLGMPGKESLPLAVSKTSLSPCKEKQHFFVLCPGGARRCEMNHYEHTSSPCPRSSRENPSSLWKSIEWPPTKTSEACRHSDMGGHNNPSQRHSPQGAIVLGMFLKLCNMRKEVEELSQSDSSVVGMLNGCNEGNCSTPAMVGGSHQICRIWPDPSLSPTPRLKEQASFVFWWKIYTVKQIRA